VILGTASVKNLAWAETPENDLITVVSAYRSGHDVKVVMAYDHLPPAAGCIQSPSIPKGMADLSSYKKREEKNAVFRTAVFKNVPPGGKLYLKACSGQDSKLPYKGTVMTLP
jgi:hypothetical protein